MSDWTHSICNTCWDERNPGRQAFRLREPDEEVCCFCGMPHASGIYMRYDPAKLSCVHTEGGQS